MVVYNRKIYIISGKYANEAGAGILNDLLIAKYFYCFFVTNLCNIKSKYLNLTAKAQLV